MHETFTVAIFKPEHGFQPLYPSTAGEGKWTLDESQARDFNSYEEADEFGHLHGSRYGYTVLPTNLK